MKAYPIDSHITYENGIPKFDRAVTSEPLRKLLKSLFKTGVDPTSSTNFQVSTNEGMNITVLPGFAIVEGCMAFEEDNRTLAVQAASSQYDRIDTVVLRLNDNDAVRECDLYVVEGIPSATPVHPDLTRSGSIYEIGLADIFVGRGAVRILADKITDTRYDNSRCGVMSSISEFDTTTLNQQMNAWSESAREEFRQWVEEIHGILDENAAGHLQNQIDELSDSVSQQIDEINQHLTANNKKYMADYVDGEYGFTINGAFYPFSGGTTYLGEFSANSTIDISELRNPSASDFIFVINEDDKISNKTTNYQDYATGYTIFYPAYISVSGSTLSLTLPREYINNNGATDSKLLKGKLYYKPSVVIGIYTENKTIDVSAYNPITVNQFVAMEVEQTQTAKGSYTTQQNYGGFTATYKKAALSLSGKTLTVNAPTTDGLNKKSNIRYKLCYLGKALKFSKQGF